MAEINDFGRAVDCVIDARNLLFDSLLLSRAALWVRSFAATSNHIQPVLYGYSCIKCSVCVCFIHYTHYPLPIAITHESSTICPKSLCLISTSFVYFACMRLLFKYVLFEADPLISHLHTYQMSEAIRTRIDCEQIHIFHESLWFISHFAMLRLENTLYQWRTLCTYHFNADVN